MIQQINLYQPIFRKEKKKFSALAMLQAAGAVVAGIVLMYAYTQWKVTDQRAGLREVEERHAALTKQVAEMGQKAKPVGQSQQLEDQIKRAERELAALGAVQVLMKGNVMANTRGYSEYLIALARQHVDGIWLTGFNISGTGERIRLQGRTVDPALVPKYVQRLASEKPLSGAEFHVFQITRPDEEKKSKDGDQHIQFLIRTASKDEAREAGKP